jgi:hypothetical protein
MDPDLRIRNPELWILYYGSESGPDLQSFLAIETKICCQIGTVEIH